MYKMYSGFDLENEFKYKRQILLHQFEKNRIHLFEWTISSTNFVCYLT